MRVDAQYPFSDDFPIYPEREQAEDMTSVLAIAVCDPPSITVAADRKVTVSTGDGFAVAEQEKLVEVPGRNWVLGASGWGGVYGAIDWIHSQLRTDAKKISADIKQGHAELADFSKSISLVSKTHSGHP